ncbi:MAG: AtpZ/AtpI family protein [Planctomycetes bacterium]|nr:AtpZ/AtpI family protein [Planctomycetota bacterium]
MEDRPDPSKDPNLWAFAGVGLELAAGIGVLAFLGWWLDKRWGTGPWLLVTGAALGFAGGFYNLWKHARRYL